MTSRNTLSPRAFPAKTALRATGLTRSPESAPSSRSRCHARESASTAANATATQITPGATRCRTSAPPEKASDAMVATRTAKKPLVVTISFV
jgi:hypothetical protein